jgi:hypothetical protein
MAGGKKLGIVYIKVDGAMLESLPGASLDMGGKMRSPVIGANAVLGFSVALKEATVECEIAVGAGTSLKALADIEDATITFECDTGQTYVISHAALAEPPKATAGEGGKVPLKFFGQPADEMGAA